MVFLRRSAAVLATSALLAPLVGACADRELLSITMALDESADRPRDHFFTDTQTIYCVADYTSGRKDLTVNAIIRQVTNENNKGVDVIIGVGELAPGISHGKLSFQLRHPMPPSGSQGSSAPFPVGKYQCELYVDALDPKAQTSEKPTGKCNLANGCQPQQVATFTIDYPSCPVTFAQQDVPCGGFYKTGQNCRGQDKTQTCTCDGNVWQCK